MYFQEQCDSKVWCFFVFQEFLRETETWKKVLQTQTYWSNICFQTPFPTFQWGFRIFFFFTFLVFFLLWKLFCTNKTQELAKKQHVNDEYNIYRLLLKIYYLQLPILNIMLVWLKRHRCDSSFKSTQHFRHSIISIMTRFGQLVRHTYFQYIHERKAKYGVKYFHLRFIATCLVMKG